MAGPSEHPGADLDLSNAHMPSLEEVELPQSLTVRCRCRPLAARRRRRRRRRLWHPSQPRYKKCDPFMTPLAASLHTV